MKINQENSILNNLAIVHYATIYNFQPWTHNKAKTLNSSLLWPTKLFSYLKKQKLIRPIINYAYYGHTQRQYRHSTFYTLTKEGARVANSNKNYNSQYFSYTLIHHQSALIDIMLGFVYGFPNYDVEIEYEKQINYTDEKGESRIYRPDAIIKLSHLFSSKIYYYILEFERTKSGSQIKTDKIKIVSKLDLKSCGLPVNTKFLFVIAHERFNVFTRPMEYSKSDVRQEIDVANIKFKHILDIIKEDYPTNNYILFTAYHNFTRLNESVWKTLDGNPRKLIQ